jgi:hypothetical protein
MGLGTALLLALALETVRRRLGTVGVAAAALVVPWQSGWTLGRPTVDEMHPAGRDAPIYRTVGEFAARLGAGPLLELPTTRGRGGPRLEPDAMLGSTWHWQPLVTGYTGYPPPHRALLRRTLARLPDRAALDDLIDMTHLRWILVRPAADWTSPSARSRFFELLAGAGAKMLWGDRDWFLVRLDRLARHPGWFAALASGPRPGRSLLGTPLAPLPPNAAARIMGTGLPPAMRPLRVGTLRARVMNVGVVPWPVAVAPDVPPTHTVRLAVGWRALDAPPEREVPAPAIVELPRDLAPGDSVTVDVALLTPREPGSYEITAAVEQVGDGTLAGPPLRLPMRIVPNEGA